MSKSRPPALTRDERRKVEQWKRVLELALLWLAYYSWQMFAVHSAKTQHARSLRQADATRRLSSGLSQVEAATVAVQDSLAQMGVETSRLQRLAIKVGVATAILGAILGGFAGAFAARIIGS